MHSWVQIKELCLVCQTYLVCDDLKARFDLFGFGLVRLRQGAQKMLWGLRCKPAFRQ